MRLQTSALLPSLLFSILVADLVLAQGTQPPSSNPPLFRGERKDNNKEDETVRSLQGVVSSQADQPVEGAVVKLKDTKTLRVRSFITQKDGGYRFHGLSTNVDYEVWADFQDMTTDQRTLSVFDSRRRAVVNLKLDKKREEKN